MTKVRTCGCQQHGREHRLPARQGESQQTFDEEYHPARRQHILPRQGQYNQNLNGVLLTETGLFIFIHPPYRSDRNAHDSGNGCPGIDSSLASSSIPVENTIPVDDRAWEFKPTSRSCAVSIENSEDCNPRKIMPLVASLTYLLVPHHS